MWIALPSSGEAGQSAGLRHICWTSSQAARTGEILANQTCSTNCNKHHL